MVYYWYQQRGRKIADEWAVKYYVIEDALTKRRTDGALMRLTTPIIEKEGEGVADRRLTKMLTQMTPFLPRYVPE